MALLLVLDVFRNIRWIGRGKQRLIFLVWHACILLHMGVNCWNKSMHACLSKFHFRTFQNPTTQIQWSPSPHQHLAHYGYII